MSLKNLAAGCGALALMAAASAGAWGQTAAEAVRINNRGVALMGQQFTEKADETFRLAIKSDPKLAQAYINDGIALMTLQKLDEAKAVLGQAIALDAKNPQAWYNLGVAQHAGNELEAAAASFEKALASDPLDADSLYFEGRCYQEMKQFDRAIELFGRALKINPLHASSEFALARSLQGAGRTPEAKEHFRTFQHITSTKIGAPIGLAYGEQGRYSTVTPVEEPEQGRRPMIAMKLRREELGAQPAATGGACMLDAQGDGRMDLLVLGEGPQAIELWKNTGKGFEHADATAAGLKASGHAVACAVGDYDSDGLNDVAVALSDAVRLFRNLGRGKFVEVTQDAGLSGRNRPTGLTFVDYDHDGDLDLLVSGAPLAAGGTANVLWRNNGNKTFTDWTEPTGLGGTVQTSAVLLTDFNNDRAVDLAVTGKGAAPLIYVNPREGKYPTQEIGAVAQTVGIASLDYDKDGWMDLAVTSEQAPGVSLWRNVASTGLSRRFERVQLPGLEGVLRGWGVAAVDIDNDGWVDLAAVVETRTGPTVKVWRNRGDGTFEDVSRVLGIDAVRIAGARNLLVAELYGDGAASLIVTRAGGAPVVLRNVGGAHNHAVRLDLTGYADNKTALGTKVEIFANGHWQKWELSAPAGPPQILAGLGADRQVDLLRILWPTGVLQDEIDLGNGPVIAMKEADRRGSSCPVLFVWDGTKFRMITDVIGAGVVGHWFTPTRRNIPNPGEWIKVPGEAVRLVNGRLSLRFMEPMEEVNYIDQLRMVAVDHPSDVEVNPDEKFLDDPPFASGKVVASRNLRLPLKAWDGEGRDVTEAIAKADHVFASGFTPTPYDGFANRHALTLELGEVDTTQPLRLLMTGYVNYFSATSLYAAWQAGIQPVAPYAEAQLPDGSWKKVSGDLGFPAGLERTIVIDLTGKLPAGATRLRLVSNLEIYWDQVRIDQTPESTVANVRTSEMTMAGAALHYRGYPTQIEGKSPGDLDYDYDRVSLTGPFQHQVGNYTRMGMVTPLLTGLDDRYVIFGSGDEIAAQFDAAGLPELPRGWRRDYFFYANGYVKDMDWWDALPYTVGELPFHGMSRYPYAEGEEFPADKLADQLEWNTRFDSGQPSGSYRFDYHQRPTTPADDLAVRP